MRTKQKKSFEEALSSHRLRPGWRYFYLACSVSLVAAAVWLVLVDDDRGWAQIVIGSALGLVGVWLAVRQGRETIEIYSDRICVQGAWWRREVPFSKIVGYRRIHDHIDYYRLQVREEWWLDVAMTYEAVGSLEEFLVSSFVNLDDEEATRSLVEIQSNARLGNTPHERLEYVLRMKTRARVINALGIALMLWALFHPRPYEVLMWSCVLAPPLVLAIVKAAGGALKLDGREREVIPNVALAFLSPILALVFRSIGKWNLASWHQIWIPSGFVALLLAAAASRVMWKEKRGVQIAVWFFCAVYGLGASLTVNGIAVSSPPEMLEARVLDKQLDQDKAYGCRLQLSAWGPRTEANEVELSRKKCPEIEVGDRVRVRLYQGRLGIPWFKIDNLVD